MQLSYGSYLHQLNECTMAVRKESLANDAGYHYGQKETWTIRGFLQAASQQALTVLIGLMQAAYSVNFQTATLLDNLGLPTSHTLPGRTAIGGTKVTGPSFPEGGGAEYSTYRQYELTIEGTYPFTNTPPGLLLSFTELLSFTGGGPRFLHLQPLTGLPQRQQTAQATPYKVTQRGQAVGLTTWPNPPGPIWPAAEHIDQRSIDQKTPKRTGDVIRSVYTEYEVTWQYYFEANVPLTGSPTLWRG